MNKTKIDWPNLDYTWNPIVGCKRNCSYCYAKKINDRFKIIPEWTELQFFEDRLLQPSKVKKPSTIFMGSMSDICYWDELFLDPILAQIAYNCRHHTFMTLTKDPNVYRKCHKWPENLWLGVTISTHDDLWKIHEMASNGKKNRKFVSIEPLMSNVNSDYECFDLVIVGAMTGPGAKPPEKSWIDSIKHPNIHYKSNIKKYL